MVYNELAVTRACIASRNAIGVRSLAAYSSLNFTEALIEAPVSAAREEQRRCEEASEGLHD